MKKETLPTLLQVIPPPEGLTAHPDRLLIVFLMELERTKERFSPDVFSYMQSAVSQILKGTDPKIALRLDLRKRDEEEWLMRICMIHEVITRKAKKEKLVDIFAELSETGYTWYGKKHYLGIENIEKIYEELRPIILKKQKIRTKLRNK